MANFRKSFNFRNGVQVDEDNFIVNSVGLVGIGTSVPTETLDVRGSFKVVGVATIQDAFIGVATVTNQLEVGITSLGSGIIAAKTGIVTYYGDARYLQGMPTSQWVDVDAGLGYTSIYASGNVGVGTTDPRFTFQVGGNNDVSNFTRGVGINSSGDVKIAGILTVTEFYGYGIGVTGLNASSAVATGNLHNDRLPSNINKPTGIITASTFVGNLTGVASTAQTLTGTPNIVVGVVTASKIVADTIEVPNTGITTVSKLFHVGTGGTAFSALEAGRIGVGTALPTSELQIRKASGSLLEVVSDSGDARISIGQSVGVGNSSGVLRFGNSANTFDIVNRDTGNLNMILHGGGSGIDTGRFDWIYGQTNAELMSLTYGGRLGIGKTNPDNTLHVVGTSTVTGNSWFGGNVTITGTLSAGTITLPSLISANVSSTTGISTFLNLNITNDLTVDTDIGIGTDAPIVNFDARGRTALIGSLGINTTTQATASLEVTGQALIDSVGIGTTTTQGEGLYVNGKSIVQHDATTTLYDSVLYIRDNGAIGVGTTAVRCQVDFGDAGKTAAEINPGEGTGSRAFMLPPRLTNTQRAGLTTEAGAVIYNTDTNKHQGWNGSSWNDFY